MAIIVIPDGAQLSVIKKVSYLNAIGDGGKLPSTAIAINLMACGLPEFRDAFRGLMTNLTTNGWTFTTEGPDDGDSVATTRAKVNAAWAGATPAP